jgi:hypothetical protein
MLNLSVMGQVIIAGVLPNHMLGSIKHRLIKIAYARNV